MSSKFELRGFGFHKVEALPPHGAPSARFTQPKSGAILSFNAAQLDAAPGLAAADRVEVFFADSTKPMIALFPCAEGEGAALLRDGSDNKRRKLKGAVLTRLAPYARVDFRVEPIEQPRKGWLLTATSSERKP